MPARKGGHLPLRDYVLEFRLVYEAWGDRWRYLGCYRKRAEVEGTYGAFELRLGETARSPGPHAQAVERLGRTVVWNLLGLVCSVR